MKIIFVSPGSSEIPPGRLSAGVQEIDYNVARQLSNRFEIIIISPFYQHYVKERLDGNLRIKYVFHPAIGTNSRATKARLLVGSMANQSYSLLAFFEILKQKDSSVVIFSEKHVGVLPAFFARILRKKVIFSEGNPYPWYSPKYFKPSSLSKGANLLFGLLACSLSHRIRAQSASIKDGMAFYGIDPKKISIIEGGVDTDLFKPQNDLVGQRREFTVGFIGRLTDEKGAPLVYEIAKRNHSRFLVVGRGMYENKISSLTNVTIIARASRAGLAKLMNMCDVFIAPHPDPSLTIIEEMACAKPVIALDSSDMRDIIRHMQNGIRCGSDCRAFCEAIERLSSDRPLREELGFNARQTALGMSWQRIAEKWSNLISASSQQDS